MTERLLTDTRFDAFELPETLIAGLTDAGFTHCTPIQKETLPVLMAGHDVAGQAQTGTGKTIAFLVALFSKLMNAPERDRAVTGARGPRALILAPTRELVVQIQNDAKLVGEHLPLTVCCAYGGVDYDLQRQNIEQGVDLLIGTPGRLIDYFKQKVFSLNDIECLVMDEADRMFDLGFIKDIRYLLRRMPPPTERQSMLFSATLSFRVSELAYEHMNNPQMVEVAPEKRTADKVSQVLYHVGQDEKMRLTLWLYQTQQPTRSLVFVNTKRIAERLALFLQANGVHAEAISGDVPQRKRQRLLREFSAGELSALVATDVAARGLHVPEVSHVINFDLPQNPEDYVHRIGRTARAGASGAAISLACEEFVYSLIDIEEYLGHKIPVSSFEPDDLPDAVTPRRPPRKRDDGKPGGKRRESSSSARSGDDEGRRNEDGGGEGRRRRRRRGGGVRRSTEATQPQD